MPVKREQIIQYLTLITPRNIRFYSFIFYICFLYLIQHLICLVREVDFVEYLRGLMLDSLCLHVVGRVLPLAHPGRPLDPLEAVQGDRVAPSVEEVGQFLKQRSEMLSC